MRSVATPRGPSIVAAAGAAMPATAEVFGDLGYIELSLAANAQTELTGIGDFGAERRRIRRRRC